MKHFFLISLFISILIHYQTNAHNLPRAPRVIVPCITNDDCIEGFYFPILTCVQGFCRDVPFIGPEFSPRDSSTGKVGAECLSIRECESDLVCVSGNPRGSCQRARGLLGISHLFTNLVQEDYTPGTEDDSSNDNSPRPSQRGPLLTSRALAIIYLSAHDTYAIVTGTYAPYLKSKSLDTDVYMKQMRGAKLSRADFERQAEYAMLTAALTAAKILYPSSSPRIDAILTSITGGAFSSFLLFGQRVAKEWVDSRAGDGSSAKLLDKSFRTGAFLRHQPDPNFPIVQKKSSRQMNFGRAWAKVKPFVLTDIDRQSYIQSYPDIDSEEYRNNLEEVKRVGQCNDLRNSDGVLLKDIGYYWGYDGAPKIGVPNRLYLGILLAVKGLEDFPLRAQLRALTAATVAMMDAGIATWYWKFKYDLWRPVIGIRNDTNDPIPGWNPIGVPLSNSVSSGTKFADRPPECVGVNPNFPAYPSGHASFGTAAFKAFATVLGRSTKDLFVTFTSEELNGRTVDGVTGKTRRVFTQTINLDEANEQNKAARVYIGVHWRFDSDAGDEVGTKVAAIVANAFRDGVIENRSPRFSRGRPVGAFGGPSFGF